MAAAQLKEKSALSNMMKKYILAGNRAKVVHSPNCISMGRVSINEEIIEKIMPDMSFASTKDIAKINNTSGNALIF